DLAQELSRIPAVKAVARPCAPGAVWKSLAYLIAPAIHAKLQEWALRPLALQEPISKAVVGLLTRAAQRDALPQLTRMPLWAYLPGRSTQDALLRVARHCHAARQLMQSLRTNPFTRQQGLPRFKIAGALQIFLDIERAFDMLSREHLFSRLHHLEINPHIIQLLALWHQETHYSLFCNGEESTIPVGKGVRQGCRAAPLLWNGYMWLFLVELSKEVNLTWVLQCLNIYADDCHMGDLYRSSQELQLLLDNINKTLLLLKKFGLTINPTKCTALLTMGGTNHRKLRASLTAWRDGKEWLCLGTTADPMWIPIEPTAKYLGTIISYRNFEDATIRHRAQLARIAFGRLKRWLTGRRGLQQKQRLQLFTTCVYPVLTYGIFSIGITTVGLQHIQQLLYCQLRQILCNHAYITGHSHTYALSVNRVALPTEWLWRSAETLQRSVERRTLRAGPHDIVHQVEWTHLADIIELLHNHHCRGPDIVIQPPALDVPLLSPQYTCQLCDFQTHDTAMFRRHCTVVHGHRMTRTLHVNLAQHMKHGLPQCRFCHQKFTTWRSFTIHAQRGCQVLQAGPTACWLDLTWPLAADRLHRPTMFAPKQDAPVRGQIQLSSTDLQNITSQEWGPRILTIVGSKNWHHMKKETDACMYLANRCCLCDQFLGRTQELHRHYKLHHPEFWPHVQTKGTQLTHLHGEDPPCPYCGALFNANHQCTVWLQLAMLLIYGGGVTTEPQPVPVTLRCEICMDTFATNEDLHAHLTMTHRLKSTSYNVARDSLAGEPVCAHCQTMYDSLESLRSHINQSRCPRFNPDLPTEVVDVLPQWVDAMCRGQFANVLRDAHVRLQLTLRCQNCSSRYQRSSSLAGHLQSAHPQLWSASQELTQVMVSLLYDQAGCLCNPGVGSGRNSHVCLPIRQLAMQHLRMEGQILFPHQPSDEELTAIFSLNLTRQQRFTLEKTITDRAISNFWTADPVLTILRETCVLCGQPMHPADLIPHLYEAHQCGQPIVHFIKTQLALKFLAHATDDGECYACQQVYNCPRNSALDPNDASRTATAQAHFRAQPPMADMDMPEAEEVSQQVWTAFQAIAPLMTDKTLILEPNAAPKRQRKGDSTPQPPGHAKPTQGNGKVDLAQAMTLMAKLALRLDRDLQQLKREDTFIYFFGHKGPNSSLQTLLEATKTWAENFQAPQPAQPVQPLRQHLMQILFNTLLTRLTQLGESERGSEIQETAIRNQILLPDGQCPYLEWDAAQKQLKISQRRPLTLKHLHQLCTDMIEHLADVNLVSAFHALPSTNKEVTAWKLQISLRADTPWQILQTMSNSAVWHLMGTALKPHGQKQSPLAMNLQQALGMHKPPKGKGKGKGKHKVAPKQE
ncbi:unnamed protein product, partial [Cladocopium goreaui]